MNVLNTASAILKNSWCQGKYRSTNDSEPTRFCALGALTEAHLKHGLVDPTEHGFYDAINKVENGASVKILSDVIMENYGAEIASTVSEAESTRFPWVVVTVFNDEVATSADEVRQMVDKAAVKLDEIV